MDDLVRLIFIDYVIEKRVAINPFRKFPRLPFLESANPLVYLIDILSEFRNKRDEVSLGATNPIS